MKHGNSSSIAVILARGGSKRLPRKNVRPLCGQPLISYTIDAAHGATLLARTIVSTDDPEIAKIASERGAEVPFLRPAELAQDMSSVVDVLLHAVAWLENNDTNVETVIALQTTSPMRRSEHIDEAIALFYEADADTVTSVTPTHAHPYWCWQIDGRNLRPFFSKEHVAMPRQQLPSAVVENGAVFVVRRSVLQSGTLYGEKIAGYVMNTADSVDVDTSEDFDYAEFLMNRRLKSPI